MGKWMVIVAVLSAFLCGIAAGWWVHPDPIWDIGEDDRAAIIQWDDGTFSVKGGTIYISDLEPGESRMIQPFK